MRLIEKLMDKAKNRPRPDLLGIICPWDNKWHFTIHKTKGRYKSRGGNWKHEVETKAFDFRDDAIKYGESVVGEKGNLIVAGFIDMEKKQVPFTTAEKEAAKNETDRKANG